MPVQSGRIMKHAQTAGVRRSARKRAEVQKAASPAPSSSARPSPAPPSPPPLPPTRDLASPMDQPPTDQQRSTNRDAIARLAQVPLSAEQQQLRATVLQFCRTGLQSFAATGRPSVFVIEGEAGTGKSVVLAALLDELQRGARGGRDAGDDPLCGTHNYLVVNHAEMLKLYHRLAAQAAHVRKTDVERPTTLINRLTKERATADVVLVDEAHLLLSRKNAYKRFLGDNQLASLLACARVLVVVFDAAQTLRFDAHWDAAGLEAVLESFPGGLGAVGRHRLAQPFRVAAAPDVHRWIRALTAERRVLPRPRTDAERRAAGDRTAFDFRIYGEAAALYAALMRRNAAGGGARLLATYDWPYRLPRAGEGGAAQKTWFVDCDDGRFRIPWDRYLPQRAAPWAEQPDSHRFCGSVYTIQGFDLAYAGVLLGPSVGYDAAADRVVVRPERCHDTGAFFGRTHDAAAADAKAALILNAVNVLLTRGVHGLYVYASDPDLRARLLAC